MLVFRVLRAPLDNQFREFRNKQATGTTQPWNKLESVLHCARATASGEGHCCLGGYWRPSVAGKQGARSNWQQLRARILPQKPFDNVLVLTFGEAAS